MPEQNFEKAEDYSLEQNFCRIFGISESFQVAWATNSNSEYRLIRSW